MDQIWKISGVNMDFTVLRNCLISDSDVISPGTACYSHERRSVLRNQMIAIERPKTLQNGVIFLSWTRLSLRCMHIPSYSLLWLFIALSKMVLLCRWTDSNCMLHFISAVICCHTVRMRGNRVKKEFLYIGSSYKFHFLHTVV